MVFPSHQVRRCVVIPDVHQDTAWVNRILDRESEADLFVFLGDYFDARVAPRHRTGVAQTCRVLESLQHQLGPRAVFLLGNHDVQYLEARPQCLRHRVPRLLHTRCGAAFRGAAAAKIAKHLPAAFWDSARLFAVVNGWLLSHAGVHASLWPQRTSRDAALDALADDCRCALAEITHEPHPLLEAGLVRGGDQAVGGITWQDWDAEFCDDLPCAQLVGHTASRAGARRRGRSWCLDGGQTCYGVLVGEHLQVREA